MPSPNVFISYRRSDSLYPADQIANALKQRLGSARVFLDLDDIPAGVDFDEHVRTTLEDTAVVLVVVGKAWLTVTDGQGRRRLDDPGDLVRREVEYALAQPGITVIPVLVDDAKVPPKSSLPGTLSRLVERQAIRLAPPPNFPAQLRRLEDRVVETLANLEPTPPPAHAVEADFRDVFVSYAPEDHVLARALVEALTRQRPGWTLVMDPPAERREEGSRALPVGLPRALTVLWVVSPKSLASPRCERERRTARDASKPIFAAIAEPPLASATHVHLPPGKPGCRIVGGKWTQVGIKRLVASLEAEIVSRRPVRPSRWGFVNFKGGVGKTTVALAAAEALACAEGDGRVLVIDVDHQANTTRLLAPPALAGRLIANIDRSLRDSAWLAEQALRLDSFGLDHFRQVRLTDGVSRIAQAQGRLHLLPASHALLDFDYRLTRELHAEHGDQIWNVWQRRVAAFTRALERFAMEERYAHVIVDSGPQFSRASLLFLRGCDHFALPMTPDFLAVEGAEYLLQRFREGPATERCEGRPRLIVMNRLTPGRPRAHARALGRAKKLADRLGATLITVSTSADVANILDEETEYGTFLAKYRGKAREMALDLARHMTQDGRA